jgi:DNA-binding MarR family transcriptional regulator
MKQQSDDDFVGGLTSIENGLEKVLGDVKSLKVQLQSPDLELCTPLERAKRHYRNRRRRELAFKNSNLFGEPAWDMLVDLFIANEEGNSISVSSLCIAAVVPGTTALRWIAILEQENLIKRTPDPNDQRRVFLSLTDTGNTSMKKHFETC